MPRLRLDFEVRSNLVKYSDGTLSLCYQCGTCTASCLLSPNLGVRSLMARAQIGVVDDSNAWKCVTCKYCEVTCPRGVKIADVVRGMRIVLYEKKIVPERLVDGLWRIYEDGNPLGSPRRERSLWTRGLKYSQGEAEVLIYTCCMNAYDRRLQGVARSLVEVLSKANVSIAIASEGESCCGDLVYNIGEEYYLEELASNNVSLMEKLKPSIILTLSPHCYNMFKNVYPRYNAKPPAPVVHYTVYLSELIASGRLKPGRLEANVTYHDPCYLGRFNGVYEEPRTILQHIDGVNLVEMEHNRENSLCCGGGGGAFWSENVEARGVTRVRLREALDTGASIMSTACPYCIRMFEDELKVAKYTVNIVDVLELLRESLR